MRLDVPRRGPDDVFCRADLTPGRQQNRAMESGFATDGRVNP